MQKLVYYLWLNNSCDNNIIKKTLVITILLSTASKLCSKKQEISGMSIVFK